jgi:hypothetical protein
MDIFVWHNESDFLVTAIIFWVAGFVLGLILWNTSCNSYNATKKRYESEDQSSVSST